MQARCPHCSNVFNTERAGIQFCPNCGQQINVPDPAATGGPATGAGVPPPPPAGPGMNRGPVPWEERSQKGVLGGFFENWKMIITQPEAFWQRMRPDGGLGDAIFFGWICFAIYGLLNVPLQLVSSALNRGQMDQMLSAAKDLPPELRALFEQYAGFLFGGGTVAVLVVEIIVYPVFLIIGAGITHLFCMMFGVSKNGFNATARVFAYAQAPYALGWIPCCGPLVAAIYSVVLLVWGLARAQDSTVGRAVAVVLVPPLLLCCCAGVIGVLAGMGAASAAQ